jgi:hypothetical protein
MAVLAALSECSQISWCQKVTVATLRGCLYFPVVDPSAPNAKPAFKQKIGQLSDKLAEQCPAAGAAMRFLLMIWQLRHIAAMLYDIITDVVLLADVKSRTWFWLLLASMFISDLIAVIRVHWFMMVAVKEQLRRTGKDLPKGYNITIDAANDANADIAVKAHALLQSWGQLLLSCYTTAAHANVFLGLLICLLLTVPVSVTLLVLMLAMPFITTWLALTSTGDKSSSAATTLNSQLEFMGHLDVYKVCSMRSFAMALLESPVFLAYSTAGFTNPYLVGKYISVSAGLASLVGSMVHIVMEMHLLKNAFLKAGSFWGGIRRRFCVGLRRDVVYTQGGVGSKALRVLGRVLTALLAAGVLLFAGVLVLNAERNNGLSRYF